MPTRADPAPPPSGGSTAGSFVWLDALKGFAMLWIVLNHVVERLWGSEFAGNPNGAWPPLAARIAQFTAPLGKGVAAVAATAMRDVGWLGDQGVTLFLIASGFGLAASFRRRSVERVAAGPFFRARAARIYPLWLGAHAVLLVVALLAFAKLGPSFVLSAAGIRFLPQTMYAFVPAWWYVGLLLQLYAVVPLLWAALRRFGPWPVLAGACSGSPLVRSDSSRSTAISTRGNAARSSSRGCPSSRSACASRSGCAGRRTRARPRPRFCAGAPSDRLRVTASSAPFRVRPSCSPSRSSHSRSDSSARSRAPGPSCRRF
jgi:peptidoglycan/LPS O-acetylase OafA/YrhL